MVKTQIQFNKNYLSRFYQYSDKFIAEEIYANTNIFQIGTSHGSKLSTELLIRMMESWVGGINRLLGVKQQLSDAYDKTYNALFLQRGVTYSEYYYLTNDSLEESEYLNTPVYIFTSTYSKDQRDRIFGNLEFSPEAYRNFILSYDLVPCRYFNQYDKVNIDIKSLYAHSYCVAKTRSGKTELLKLIVYELAKNKDPKTSLLVLDPHGEFARELRRLKELNKNLDRFVYLDPTIDDDHSPVFNPFEVDSNEITHLAYACDTILDAFEQLLKDQAVTGNMRRLLRHCIYNLLYLEDSDLMDMLILLNGISRNRSKKEPLFYPDEERLMNAGRNVNDPLTRRFFEHGWKDVDARTITAVIERVDGILSHPIIRRFIVGKNTLNFSEYLNTGKIVVINLDFTKLGNIGSEAIGRLIVSEAQNISAQRNKLAKADRPRTIIFMDECQRFVSAAIERALSEFAKFNTFLFLAHQYIDQIDDGMVKAMLSNTENKFVGRNSAATMTSISPDVGVSKENLLKVKKYQFYMKIGDDDPLLFSSSDKLVEYSNSKFYLSEMEAKEHVDQYMIEKYYSRIKALNLTLEGSKVSRSENGQKETQISQKINVQIDPNDF